MAERDYGSDGVNKRALHKATPVPNVAHTLPMVNFANVVFLPRTATLHHRPIPPALTASYHWQINIC